MPNTFDQFDQPGVRQIAPSPVGRKNVFDQFGDAGFGDYVVDSAKALGSGVVQGAYGLAALPGDAWEATHLVGTMLGDLARRATGKGGTSDPGPDPLENILPQSSDLMQATGFTPYKPKYVPGQFAETIGSFVPGALAFGGAKTIGDALANVGRYAVLPGAASEGAGQLTKGTWLEGPARITGAMAGGMVPSRIVTPFPASAARNAAVKTLEAEGVTDLTAGQKTGSKALQYLESENGGLKGQKLLESQGDQFTGAALAKAGESASRATPEVIDHAFTRIGNTFDALSAKYPMPIDGQFFKDFSGAIDDYLMLVPDSQRSPIIQGLMDDVTRAMQRNPANPVLSGEAYQATRSRLGRLARTTNDPQLAEALSGIQNAMDGSVQRVMTPADAEAWASARSQYKNLLAIEKAATGAGENTAAGVIAPKQLRAALVGQNRRAYARGRGDLADLARAGEQVMTPPPNSGTAARVAARAVPAAVGGTLAAALAGGDAGVMAQLAAPGALIGALTPGTVGRAALSRAGRSYLSNQLIPRGKPTTRIGMALAQGNQAMQNRSDSEAVKLRR